MTDINEIKMTEEQFNTLLERAKNGNAEDMYKIGCLYLEGKHVEQDYYEATKWLSKASQKGFELADNNLKWMEEKGILKINEI